MVEIVGGRILQNAAFGSVSFSIPFPECPECTETCSAGYGGSHPAVFIDTNFPVTAATVSFEREFGKKEYFEIDEEDEQQNLYKDGRSAAHIKVRYPIEPDLNGFWVDFGQGIGLEEEQEYNEPFVLSFNWMAVGGRK